MYYAVAILVYFLIGLVLGVPYVWLAGWSRDHVLVVMLLAPFTTIVSLCLGIFAGFFNRPHRRVSTLYFREEQFLDSEMMPCRAFFPLFCIMVTAIVAPIVMHWAAVSIAVIGYADVAKVLEAHRYAGFFYVLLAAAVLSVVLNIVGSRLMQQERES